MDYDHEVRIITYPVLPSADITPLERLVLITVLECSETEKGLVLFTDDGPENPIYLKRYELLSEYHASTGRPDSALNQFMATHVFPLQPEGDDGAAVKIDLGPFPWQFIVQNILARLPEPRELVVIQTINHVSQRPETYGVTVSLITRNGIHHTTSEDLLARFREWDRTLESGVPATADNSSPPGSKSVGRPQQRAEPGTAANSSEMETAACIWEVMLSYRKLRDERRPTSVNILQMLDVWDEVGWAAMRRFACDIVPLAIDARRDLPSIRKGDGAAHDFDFIRAVVAALSWSYEGPFREGEPEEFLEEVETAAFYLRQVSFPFHVPDEDGFDDN